MFTDLNVLGGLKKSTECGKKKMLLLAGKLTKKQMLVRYLKVHEGNTITACGKKKIKPNEITPICVTVFFLCSVSVLTQSKPNRAVMLLVIFCIANVVSNGRPKMCSAEYLQRHFWLPIRSEA